MERHGDRDHHRDELGLRDELAANAYWAGRHRDCLDAGLTLLASEALAAGDRPRVAASARFAVEALSK